MKLLWQVEWLRFIRRTTNVCVLGVFTAVLTASAIWSALEAREIRAEQAAQRHEREETIRNAVVEVPEGAALDAAAKQAFYLGRANSGIVGLTQLAALEGLALGVSRFRQLSTDIRVSVESRFADGRRSDNFINPALGGLGYLDLATVIVLFLPLAVIALGAGLVQEDRDSGVWRMVCAQTITPWKSLFIAHAVRWATLTVITVAISLIAISVDPKGSLNAVVTWSVFVGVYCAWWVLLCALTGLLRVSSGTTIMIALGGWLLLTLIVPGILETTTARTSPAPSRLASIVEMRAIQLLTEEDTPTLVNQWYENHPGTRPVSIKEHTWPITFLPRFEAQDAQLRPLMFRFEQVQSLKEEQITSYSWLSPALALISAADYLAGVNAKRYEEYINEVNTFELQWREFLTPKIMSYQGLAQHELRELPVFAASPRLGESRNMATTSLVNLLLGVFIQVMLLFFIRRRFHVIN